MEDSLALIKYIERNHIPTPVQLEMEMKKFIPDPRKQGHDRRYMRVYINGHDVTAMACNMTACTLSKAKDSYGCLITIGTGMDMFEWLQNTIACYATNMGYKDIFDDQLYKIYKKKKKGEK